MAQKIIYIFDEYNDPLRISGITFELFDSTTNTLIDKQNSSNLNTSLPASQSNEWGVQLTFTPRSNPLDVLVSDLTFNYPGNLLRYLNGQSDDRIDIDLLQLPNQPGGQSLPLKTSNIPDLISWVQGSPKWNIHQKNAVINLISNYVNVFIPLISKLPKLTEMRDVADNWEKAMGLINIPVSILKAQELTIFA
jgi:hypothetical protein